MRSILLRLRGPMIAIVALALSATLVFGAQPASPGANGRGHDVTNGDTGASGEPEAGGDENTEETEGTETETTESADNCLVDPTTLTPEELAAMSHGSIVCWAAHQTEWPEWFSNHGKFVSCWAHTGKADAPSCTVAPAAAATVHGNGKAKGKSNKPTP